MRTKILLSLLLLVLLSPTLLACDICGCGVGSYYLGILPDFKKRFIGIRYQHKGLLTHVRTDGTVSYLSSDETYQTLDLWGAWNLGKRFRVMAILPYNFNQRINQGKTFSDNGIGDAAVFGYYKLLDTRHTTSHSQLLVQSLWIGAGVKAPTGHYNSTDKNVSQNSQNTFQLGTGSLDFSLHAMYDLRLQDLGMNTNLSYKINTANGYNYQYGNKLTLNWLAYYKLRVNKKIGIAPNAGLLWESSAKDINQNGNKVFESGGQSLMGTLGAEISFGNFGIGGNFQAPIHQNLAGGTVQGKNRALIQVTWSF